MKKKILIVDDSALMRRILSDIIDTNKDLETVDTAYDGQNALELVMKNAYDCILLDIQMPRMTGVEFLKRVNELGLKLTVVVVSSIASEGGKETIECLEYGAFDFVKKPSSLTEIKSSSFGTIVLERVHMAIESRSTTGGYGNGKTAPRIIRTPKTDSAKYVRANKLVAIACSTGGPKSLQDVVPYLPSNLDAPVLIVQHMPEGFTKPLAERLNGLSEISVKEAEDGEVLEKGTVYIAKGGYQLYVKVRSDGKHALSIVKDPPRGGLRPCADIMYESIRNTNYEQIICAVLTGMGGDGTSGIKSIMERKKVYVIAQDKESSVVYGMPKVVFEAGITDEVQPLGNIAEAITNITGVY